MAILLHFPGLPLPVQLVIGKKYSRAEHFLVCIGVGGGGLKLQAERNFV